MSNIHSIVLLIHTLLGGLFLGFSMKETGIFPENSAFMVMVDVFLWLQLYQRWRNLT